MSASLVCNELSFIPLAANSTMAEVKFKELLVTFRAAKDRYEFSHIRFPSGYSSMQITADHNFAEWISEISSPIVRNLVLGIVKAPYTDDLEEQEIESYVESDFEVVDPSCPTKQAPFGLPVALIKSVPSISLTTHDFWKQAIIQIRNKVDKEGKVHSVYNLSHPDDCTSDEIEEWSKLFLSVQISTQEELRAYLSFDKYECEFAQDFMTHLFTWKRTNLDKFKYVLRLMKDVETSPFAGGLGRTENLKNRGKEASKRITITDRLSYVIENDVISFISCSGHYEFH